MAAGSGSPASQRRLRISTSPALEPVFQPQVHDYVARCGTRGLHLDADAPSGTHLLLDGASVAKRHLRRWRRLGTGEETTVSLLGDQHRSSYRIRCLPSDFPRYTAEVSGPRQARWYIVTPHPWETSASYVAILDRNGVPVWWMREKGATDNATLGPGGTIAWVTFLSERVAFPAFAVHTLDGRTVENVSSHGVNFPDWHELRPTSNGDFLILGTDLRDGVDLHRYGGPRQATVSDGVVQEVTPRGNVVWSWSTAGHLHPAETGRWYKLSVLQTGWHLPDGRTSYDLYHLNSASEQGDRILISARQTDALYEIDRSSGKIIWKLGGTRTKKSLTVIGTKHPERLFGGQHDATLLPNGTVTVHDNSAGWNRAPRALRLKIDLARRTARVIDRFVLRPRVGSFCCGSVRRLPGGDWVISWGAINEVEELQPDGHPVLTVRFRPGVFSYRAIPVLGGQLSGAAIRRGMDAMAAAARASR
ncbi:MAG: aryl-sulfate sulfotransferase [Actinobacteria bacterium]|nr:aryl-sulfate sulfotransferase [Actinomycetota bacterium]